jgi:hypothetical protein
VRAVVGLVRDFGFDLDKIVEGRRKDYHHESLENAERARMRANMVGRSVPEPPFPWPGSRKPPGEIGTYRVGLNPFVDRGSQGSSQGSSQGPVGVAQHNPGANRRRPYWK